MACTVLWSNEGDEYIFLISCMNCSLNIWISQFFCQLPLIVMADWLKKRTSFLSNSWKKKLVIYLSVIYLGSHSFSAIRGCTPLISTAHLEPHVKWSICHWGSILSMSISNLFVFILLSWAFFSSLFRILVINIVKMNYFVEMILILIFLGLILFLILLYASWRYALFLFPEAPYKRDLIR